MEDKISFYTSRSDNYSFMSSGYITTNIIARLPVFILMEKYSKNFTNGKIILIVNFYICYSEVISCRHLLQVGEETNHNYPDAVYKIYPIGSQPIMAYCDMSRDGGGWTLLVTSHTNSWTAQNVKLRNANSPKLTDDYSILQYADSIKDNIKVAGSTFEYRLEAQSRGNSLYSRNLVPFQTGRAGVGWHGEFP